MSDKGWSAILELDDAGVEKALHIMPVVLMDGFKTKREAEKFLDTVEKSGFPCVTNEEGNVTATYFGHTAHANCNCFPELKRDSLIPTYVHRMIQ